MGEQVVLDAVSALIIMEDVKIVMYVCPSPRNAYKPAKPPHYTFHHLSMPHCSILLLR